MTEQSPTPPTPTTPAQPAEAPGTATPAVTPATPASTTPGKPGWQSTEFWLAVAGMLFGVWLSHKGKDELAALIFSIAVSVYPAARTWVKSKAAVMLLVVGLLGCAAVVHAASGQSPGQGPPQFSNQAYLADAQTSAFATITGPDSSTVLTQTYFANRGTPFATAGRATIPVSARFTTSGANCVVRLLYTYRTGGTYHMLGMSPAYTLTASATITDNDGRWVADTLLTDSYGSTHIFVYTVSISAGQVYVWLGSY